MTVLPTLQIGLGTDDCRETSDSTLDLTSTELLNIGFVLPNLRDAGLRFQSVDIPQGAIITSAILSVYLTADSGTFSGEIKGIDEDNTVTWAANDRPSQRAQTTATISANEGDWGNWGIGNWITLDIASVIQEIVGRGNWTANNALAIVLNAAIAAAHYISFRAYEYAGNAHGAKLDIVYELPAVAGGSSMYAKLIAMGLI